MLASTTDAPPDKDLRNPALVYEPKYDGIRALVALEPAQPAVRVRIWSRLGNEKTSQFPDVVRALREFGRRLRHPVLLDGEIVALDERGEPANFQRLQGRMHLAGERDIARESTAQRAAFIAFDMLRDGGEDLRPLILTQRRARLERLFGASGSAEVRHGDYVAGDGTRLYQQATEAGWEGLVSKRADSRYESGRRSPCWCKLKLHKTEELVVGGWTEPRETRQHFGSLLLGVFDSPSSAAAEPGAPPIPFRYVGHVGTGFTGRELARLHKLLAARATDARPFSANPPSNERPHWVRPELVVQVRFTGWTDEAYLRHPVYLGLRDDVRAEAVTVASAHVPEPKPAAAAGGPRRFRSARASASSPARTALAGAGPATGRRAAARPSAPPPHLPDAATRASLDALVDRLSELEAARRDAALVLPDGSSVDVTNLAKPFWPAERLTKGDLLRYYVRVSPWLLPAVEDRPLVMKRFPNGVKGKAFYQQRASDNVPPGVRVETVEDDGEPDGVMPRYVGGSLQTLLYVTQLAAISQDPWFSRVQSPEVADYVALDLDPMPGVPFSQVLDVARWLYDDLERLGVPAVAKTSGSSGLHIYIPLPPGTPYEAGLLLCQIFATLVAHRHPREATVERTVGKRGRTVYVDYLQNILGKTLATAYSARASEFAGVSTPLTWDEIADGLDPTDFTMKTVLPRFDAVGDLWRPVLTGPPVDIQAVLERLAAAGA
jgi:bifunctional non-homologous end joining protein LigD